MSQVDVTIMGQAYKLACKEGEQAALIQAAAYLDEKMCAFRDSAKIKGTDRIAVMAALTISAELLATKAPTGPFSEMSLVEIKKQMSQMEDVLDTALSAQETLF
ncbi:cell division protein ZapA [Sapientia aquatica]|uniref:Cell division protein ZapA n=1 Tax=Sapientia aquatica TaxID=1549640 RepID=A0A4R5W4I6_9BURK|nr:cell division protein ZapA [Sapientia aquatica]TDK67992.1 cell division protein ZapA [Sapientia aquatica]